MKPTQLIWTTAIALIASITLLSLPSQVTAADEEKYMSGSYPVSAESQVKISFAVGSIQFTESSGDQLEVELKATATNEGFWGGKGDLSQVELRASQQGHWLALEVPEQDNVQLAWLVKVPQVQGLDLELGIGEVKGRLYSSDLEIDLGIGDIKLTLLGDVKSVHVDVGIGESEIIGSQQSSRERALVTSSSQAEGQGQARVNIDAGIGDVKLVIE